MAEEIVSVLREEAELVTRSAVEPGLPYAEYRQPLRYDFFHSCAYCTMSEAEASGFRFTIDHYEPKSSFPELTDVYDNLMYCCDTCNMMKGSRVPSQAARDAGLRYFRPDLDRYSEHFRRLGLRLQGLTEIANFTIDAVNLNRHPLQKLRELRERLEYSEAVIAGGIRAIARTSLDQLPPTVRNSVQKALAQLEETFASTEAALDEILRQHVRSPMLDADPDAEARNRDRLKRLKDTEARYPGQWRVPR